MQTIAFYSYKGGTGRSLTLANAARYLARLEFKVVALDLDLEAPGLHYKFSSAEDGSPLSVDKGVVDYLHTFLNSGTPPPSLEPYALNVPVPGVERSLLKLLPAGSMPSRAYWSQLAAINWYDLFYSPDATGVQLFMEFKSRIEDELKPDFLLIDSRTGITELGGVATTLLADRAICVVLPTRENLDGARTVLQSIRRSRRVNGQADFDVMVALSRLSQKEPEEERKIASLVSSVLAEPALESQDTIVRPQVFLLHSEAGLELRDSLRIGSGVSPDDSILLRDYLRLFAGVVPAQSVESKIGGLIEAARNKMWEQPDVAQKELEEFAESFGRPETYRALLQFYGVRNISGALILKTAQRLWEVTGDASEVLLWHVLQKDFRTPRRPREGQWMPRMDFVEAVWADAGKKDPAFAMRLAETYAAIGLVKKGAELLLSVIRASTWTPPLLAMAVRMLDAVDKSDEADKLIRDKRDLFEGDPTLIDAWAEHALFTNSRPSLTELAQSPAVIIRKARPLLAAQVFVRLGMVAEANASADEILRDALEGPLSEAMLAEVGRIFDRLGRLDDFEERIKSRVPSYVAEQLRERIARSKRQETP